MIFRVDLHQFPPDLTRFLNLAQMAKRDGEEGAREIGFRTKLDALAEPGCRGRVVAGDQICRAEKMEVMVVERRIEADRLLDIGHGGERLAAIDVDDAARIVRLSVVRTEVQRDIRLDRGSVKILLPEVEDGSDVMHEGDLRTLLQGQVEIRSAFSSDWLQSSVQWNCQFRIWANARPA